MPTQAVAEEQITIVGTLQKSKRGIVLNADEETYLIMGQDLSTLIGRKVKITGKLIENYRGKSLLANIVEIVRE
jgi:F0F1-type ATP synthase alpha subunit